MGFQIFQSLFTSSGISAAILGLSVVGLTIWWIVRKRIRDFWMPIVRVLDFPVSRLPRIVVKKPPMIPFLMFLLATLAIVLWSNRPRLKIFSDFEPGMSQVHVYVDMSPSVSAQITLAELGQKLVSVLEQTGPKSRVTFGTSHGDDVYELTSPDGAADLITGMGFHRGGAKIGAGVRSQLSRIGEVDQLFVISDRDQHSWSGFQWQYLLVDADIRHVDIDSSISRSVLSNIFIQDARFTSTPGSLTMDWDIEIAEGALAQPASGTISASLGGESLATANWEIPAGRRSTAVSVSWPSTRVSKDLSAEPIEWTIEVSGGDALVMDNKFRSPVLGRRDRVVVVGEPSGELRLEDALMPLETALRVSGFEVERYDQWPSQSRELLPEVVSSARFLAVLASDSASLDLWCPLPLSKLVPVWMIPGGGPETYSAICRCLSRFSMGVSQNMCGERMSREDWIATLVNVGAKQIGGDVGFANQAVALRLMEPQKGFDFTILTIPLRPDPKFGISWGSFPVLVSQLASFTSGQIGATSQDSQGLGGLWPRVSDVLLVPPGEQLTGVTRTQILRETNVPVGESMLAVMPASELPPAWSSSGSVGRSRAAHKRDSEDPWPWVRALVALVVLASFVEVFWIWRRDKSGKSALGWLLPFALGVWFCAPSAFAQVTIEWLGPKASTTNMFQTLAREVSSRTSLDLSPQPEFLNAFDEKMAQYPWLWTQTPSKIAGKDGRISNAGRLWLKRGGLLIIDGQQSDAMLESFFEPFKQGTVNPSGWMSMPPDHEFMRSFYLLNSLPTCKGRPWKIFSFDGRVVAIAAPYSLLMALQDQPSRWACESNVSYEQQVRIFVNLLMMAFTTDYKRDQIHLPEILKRLRVP